MAPLARTKQRRTYLPPCFKTETAYFFVPLTEMTLTQRVIMTNTTLIQSHPDLRYETNLFGYN